LFSAENGRGKRDASCAAARIFKPEPITLEESVQVWMVETNPLCKTRKKICKWAGWWNGETATERSPNDDNLVDSSIPFLLARHPLVQRSRAPATRLTEVLHERSIMPVLFPSPAVPPARRRLGPAWFDFPLFRVEIDDADE
jgi:hypothetical protein